MHSFTSLLLLNEIFVFYEIFSILLIKKKKNETNTSTHIDMRRRSEIYQRKNISKNRMEIETDKVKWRVF